MIGEIHVNDIGTNLKVTIKNEDDEVVDISAAVTKNMIFKKPDGSIVTKAGSFTTDGTDGGLTYTTEDGFLDLHGKWELQAFIDFGSTEWFSDVYKFTVYKNLGC